jgi:HrpA-like RNA helicase
VRIPKHQFEELRELLKMVKPKYAVVTDSPLKPPRIQVAKAEDNYDDNVELNKRQASLRQAQKKCPLPVDKVESEIPYDAAITIVRGGTGSGKTTRYPLMLSLFSPTGKATKVYVAQPRRLACQTVARRVASEQRVDIGRKGSHVGYIIRFEAFPASAQGRTIDFMTPGVLLRQASHDPLFRDVTHLCIDEVHERNADMDLLLALAKEAQIKRAKHPQLPPLQLILMSATLDTEQWESYFKSSNGDSPNIKVVDIPEERRFPIDVVHIGEKQFPILRSSKLLEGKRALGEKFDENLCQVAAELAVHLFYSREFRGGSILCFLPGIEEIRQVDRIIQYTARRNSILPQVKYLHSSLNSDEQAQVFVPGNKIILSTNMGKLSARLLTGFVSTLTWCNCKHA